jgi:hypothetical protein
MKTDEMILFIIAVWLLFGRRSAPRIYPGDPAFIGPALGPGDDAFVGPVPTGSSTSVEWSWTEDDFLGLPAQ